MYFNFYLGGYGRNNNYQLKLEKDLLYINEFQGVPIPELNRIVSVNENNKWQVLLDFLKACNWKKNYYNKEILDGTQWELMAKGADINIKSNGSNAYPEDFDVFLDLVNRVISVVGIVIE